MASVILPEPAHFRRFEGAPENRVLLTAVPWAQYDALTEARQDRAGPRLSYLDGVLEIMSPGRPHEHVKKLLARLLEAYGEERGLSLNGFGSETFKRKSKEAGVEPDECYCLGNAKRLPDLAIEVCMASGGIDKLEIYRRLRVPEVWFWIDDRIHVYVLGRRGFEAHDRSHALPDLDLRSLARTVAVASPSRQTETVRAFRRSLRRRAPGRR